MNFNFFRNFLAAISIWTMIFSPVAFGLQSQAQFNRVTQEQMKSMLIDLGLNKKTTYAQFWDRTKHLYPAQVYSDVEAYFKAQPSTLMPAFDVTYTQSAKGEKIPTIKITERGQTYNVEIIGELNEWARVNQVSLSEGDLTRLKPAIEKLSPGSTKLEVYRKDFARFEGFPRMTPQAWRTMKPEERAAYIVKMRLLWFEARRVIEANEPEARVTPNQKKPKKTSSFEEFIKLMIGEDANAQQLSSGLKDAQRRNAGRTPRQYSPTELTLETNYQAPCKSSAPYKGGGCIVAGHVAPENGNYTLTYNSNSPTVLTCACNYDSVVSQRTTEGEKSGGPNKDYQAQQEKLDALCANNSKYSSQTSSIKNAEKGKWVSCQTDIYSFNPNDGTPFCIHTMSPSFQKATAFDTSGLKNASLETCDQQAKLNKTEYKPIGTPDENHARTEAEQAQGDYLETKNYLDGMFKAKNMGVNVDLILGDRATHSKTIDDFMVEKQKAFEDEINKAIKLCMAGGSKHEPNHGVACEQLHRRWLFTEKFLAQYRQKACLDKSTYIGTYDSGEKILSSKEIVVGTKKMSKTALNKMTFAELKDQPVCKCEGRQGKMVAMGEKCSAASTTPTPTPICPPGSAPAPTGSGEAMTSAERDRKETCVCDSNKKQFPGYEDKDKTNDEFKKACTPAAVISPLPPAPRDDKRDCNAEFPHASPLDENCKCTAGSRKDDYPVETKLAPVEDRTSGTPNIPAQSKWSCDEKVSLWPLIPFGLLALLMFKKKKDNPPTCTGLNQIMKLGYCVCKFSDPAICPAGAKSDCSGCAAVPTCSFPQSAGTPPLCYCPNRDTCVGKNVRLQPTTCICEPVEGGTTPDQCVGSDCSGGTPPITPTGR